MNEKCDTSDKKIDLAIEKKVNGNGAVTINKPQKSHVKLAEFVFPNRLFLFLLQ